MIEPKNKLSKKGIKIAVLLLVISILGILVLQNVRAVNVLNNAVFDDSVPKTTFLENVVQSVENLLGVQQTSVIDQNFEVKLLSNTNYCLIDCESVYEITSLYKGKRINYGTNFGFNFKNKQNNILSRTVEGLKNSAIFVNGTETTIKYCSNYTSYDCSVTDNENHTVRPQTCYSQQNSYPCGVENKESWTQVKNNDFLGLNNGDSFKIKIVGKKNPQTSIDNVLNLNFENTQKNYEQWTWWNTTCNNKKKLEFINPSTSPNLNNATITLVLNSTNYPFKTNDDIFRILNSTEDGIVQFYKPYYNQTENKAIIKFNNVNNSWGSSSNMTYWIYYSCNGLSDSNNQTALHQNNLSVYYSFDEKQNNQINDSSNGFNPPDTGGDVTTNKWVNGMVGSAWNQTEGGHAIRLGILNKVTGGKLFDWTAGWGIGWGFSFWYTNNQYPSTVSQTKALLSWCTNDAQCSGSPTLAGIRGSLALQKTSQKLDGNVQFIMDNNNINSIVDGKVNDSSTATNLTYWHHYYVKYDGTNLNFSIDGGKYSVQGAAVGTIQPFGTIGGVSSINFSIMNETLGSMDEFRWWKGTPGWNTYNEVNITQIVSNEQVLSAINIQQLLSNNTNMYITSLQNFSWKAIGTNATYNCSVIVNNTLNVSRTDSQNNTVVTQFINFTNTFVNNTWAINCSDGSMNNQTVNFVFSVTNAPISFNQTMTAARVLGGGGIFIRQVNCSATSGNPVTYTNNQTQLFNISSTTGLINYSALTSQAGNYTTLINCSDGVVSAQNSFNLEVVGIPPQFYFNNNITNLTSFETDNQTFYINITYNASNVDNLTTLTSKFVYNNNSYELLRVFTTNDTGNPYSNTYNNTLFKANIIIDLTSSNNSAINYSFNITSTKNNKINDFVYNDSVNVLFDYNIQSLSLPNEIIEGDNVRLLMNVSHHNFGLAIINASVDFNRTNFSMTSYFSNSSFNNFENNVTMPLLDEQNRTINIYGYLNLSYNNINVLRTWSQTNTSFVQKMVLTNCSAGTESVVSFMNHTVRDELTNVTVVSNYSSSYVVFNRLQSLNRTYGFTQINVSNFSVCGYPRGGSFNISSASIYYWSGGYNTRNFYHSNMMISNASESFNLLLLSSANNLVVSLKFQDENFNLIQGVITKAFLQSLINPNVYDLVDSETSGANGVALMNLQGNRTYRFDYYVSGVLKSSQTLLITSDSFTIQLVLGHPPTLQPVINIREFKKNAVLTCNNNTGNISLSWNDINSVTSSVCLNVYNHTGLGLVILNSSCSTSKNSVITFGPYNNNSIYTGSAKATNNNDGNTYLVDSCDLIIGSPSVLTKFGLAGLFLFLIFSGTFITGTVIGTGKPGYAPLALGLCFYAGTLMNITGLSYTIDTAVMAFCILLFWVTR